MVFAFRMIAVAVAALLHSGALKPEPPFKAISQMTGANTAIEYARVCVITNSEDWKQLWRAHHASFTVGAPAGKQDDDIDRPKVDFATVAVVCLFGGQSKNVGSFRVSDSGDENGRAYLRVEPTLLPNSGTTILQNPFIFVVVPKTRKKIVVQLDQAPLGGEGWRTLATIPPTKTQ